LSLTLKREDEGAERMVRAENKKSPQGLRLAGFQDFVEWFWWPSTKNLVGWRLCFLVSINMFFLIFCFY